VVVKEAVFPTKKSILLFAVLKFSSVTVKIKEYVPDFVGVKLPVTVLLPL
jgi:hypothetical protein